MKGIMSGSKLAPFGLGAAVVRSFGIMVMRWSGSIMRLALSICFCLFLLSATVRASAVPAGSVLAWSSDTIPDGWLLADGQSVSQSTYPDLYAVLGCSFGCASGDFTLPDLRAKFLFGSITPDYSETPFEDCCTITLQTELFEMGGEYQHQLTVDEMPIHRHDIYRSGPKFIANGSNHHFPGYDNTPVANWTQYEGGDHYHNNIPPYTAVHFIIASENDPPSIPSPITELQASDMLTALNSISGTMASLDARIANLETIVPSTSTITTTSQAGVTDHLYFNSVTFGDYIQAGATVGLAFIFLIRMGLNAWRGNAL